MAWHGMMAWKRADFLMRGNENYGVEYRVVWHHSGLKGRQGEARGGQWWKFDRAIDIVNCRIHNTFTNYHVRFAADYERGDDLACVSVNITLPACCLLGRTLIYLSAGMLPQLPFF